jgi:hypothetical protein
MGGVEFKIVDAKVRAPLGNLDKTFASIINGLIIIAVIGGLTHFRKAQSTHAQRSWLMIWYVFGFVIGYVFLPFHCLGPRHVLTVLQSGIIGEASTIETRKSNSPILTLPIALAMLLYGIPSIGGFVVVAQMLWNYGICTGNS